jgi:hypothetical protein
MQNASLKNFSKIIGIWIITTKSNICSEIKGKRHFCEIEKCLFRFWIHLFSGGTSQQNLAKEKLRDEKKSIGRLSFCQFSFDGEKSLLGTRSS